MKNEACGKCDWFFRGVCEKFHVRIDRIEACAEPEKVEVVSNKEENHERVCEPDKADKKRPGRKKKGV